MRRANVLIVILLAVLALMLLACGKDDPTFGAGSGTTTATPTTAPTPASTSTSTTQTQTGTATQPTPKPVARTSADGCEAVAPPQPLANPDRRRPKVRLNPHRVWIAKVTTNCGTFRLRLSVGLSPKTTSSFAALARSRFYDGLTFHRISKPGGNDFVIQGGDPLGTGNGGPGYTVVEPPPKNAQYTRYVAAMAKTQTDPPGASGSQFFIVTAANSQLPPEYALLGRVVGDKSAITRIAAVPTDPQTEKPVDPVVMQSVTISSTAG